MGFKHCLGCGAFIPSALDYCENCQKAKDAAITREAKRRTLELTASGAQKAGGDQ